MFAEFLLLGAAGFVGVEGFREFFFDAFPELLQRERTKADGSLRAKNLR